MKKPNRRVGVHYVAALDLGEAGQPTALAVLEQEVIDLPFRRGRELRALKLRHLKRFPLDASYADIGTETAKVIARLGDDEQAKGGTDLVIDITGTGRPVGEIMKREGLDPIFVTVTGSAKETEVAPRDWHISRNDLVGRLRVLFQDKRFRVSKKMPLVEKFVEELQSFSMKKKLLNTNDPESWRERPDDDLVLAVAIAAWRAKRHLPKPPATRERENKKFDEYYAEQDRRAAAARFRRG